MLSMRNDTGLREGLIIRSSEGGLGLVCDPGLDDDNIDIDPVLQDDLDAESVV